MKILVDADVLIAIAKVDDTNHERAVATAAKHTKATLFITPFTIPEAATVLSYRVSQQAAIQFIEDARRRKFIELPFEVASVEKADEIFLSQKKKGTSWVDCFNAAIYRANRMDAIFSFDRFYKRLGLKIIT